MKLIIHRCNWSWQFNGKYSWHDVIAWCYKNLDDQGWYTNKCETIYFRNERAYLLFLLRWS